MTKRLLPQFVVLLTLVFSVRSSSAAAATINFMGEGKGANVSIHSPTLGNLTVRAGELNWSAASSLELAALFYGYCVDATQYLNASQSITIRPSNQLATARVDDAGSKAAWLVNTYAAGIHNSGSDVDAAGLQVAIWAALYNNDTSLTSGNFYVNGSSPVTTQAQFFLNNLATTGTGYRSAAAMWLDASNGQDQMLPAPEPGTMMLMGTGLLIAWRRARQA